MDAVFSEIARRTGLLGVDDQWEILVARAKNMVEKALNGEQREAFRLLPTYISAASSATSARNAIVVDIGGTSTKVGIREVSPSGNQVYWKVLFEDNNDDFKVNGVSGNSLERFAQALANRVKCCSSIDHTQPGRDWNIGIVWSNALDNYYVPGIGIQGRIANRSNYTKNEWFNEEVVDGMDVGKIFLQSFNKEGVSVGLSIVANDTPLTFKAIPGANAGMVASTGVNATLVRSENGADPQVYNAEMGTVFKVGSDLISEGDMMGPDQPAHVIEHLIAGRALPRLFVGNVINMAKHGLSELSNIAATLASVGGEAFDIFSAEDVCNLLYRPEIFKSRFEGTVRLGDRALSDLQTLSKFLIHRSGKLAGLLAFASIYSQVSKGRRFKIALDSRLAREVPLFWEVMKTSLNELLPDSTNAEITLVQRLEVDGGVLSVPMLGAAQALDSL